MHMYNMNGILGPTIMIIQPIHLIGYEWLQDIVTWQNEQLLFPKACIPEYIHV